MKNIKWVGLVTALAFPLVSGYAQTPEAPVPGVAAQAQATAPVNLSPGAAEVVRLAGSGVSDDVVLAYIQNSQAPFNLSADAVLYLKDIGLSPQVISAMLSHDSTLRNQPQQYAPAAPVQATPPPVAPETAAPAEPPPPATAPPPAYVTSAPADVNYFYNDLSPYGTWVSLEGYGWCWQPRTVVISRGWRPYCDGGHWVYTDAGWFWQSDYSWGWAPFHYGRWYQHPRCGWVWTPDRVWGPAWVTWRASGDACGWAPLPPHASFDVRLGWRYNGVSVGASFDFGLGIGAFAFVSFGDFCGHDLGHHCLPPARVTTIYHQTTVINNYEVHNNTIVHRGIPIERVSAASRAPVPRATVRDLPAGSARMPSRTASVVYRPQLQAPARPVHMEAQKVDTQHPAIQHAPIAPGRTAQPTTFSRGGSAPGAAAHRPAVESPKASPWSSGAKPSSSPQYQPAPRTSPPAPTPATPKTSPWSTGAKPSSASQYQPTPRTSQPTPTAEAPKASPWSSNTKPASSPQRQSTANPYQPAPAPATPQAPPGSSGARLASSPPSQPTARTYQPAPTMLPAPAAPKAPDNWKQGSRSAPGYRSDTGLPALNNARTAGQSPPAAAQTPSQGPNPHVYQPKSHQQAAEIHSLPKADQRPSASPSSPGKSPDSKSGKNQ